MATSESGGDQLHLTLNSQNFVKMHVERRFGNSGNVMCNVRFGASLAVRKMGEQKGLYKFKSPPST